MPENPYQPPCAASDSRPSRRARLRLAIVLLVLAAVPFFLWRLGGTAPLAAAVAAGEPMAVLAALLWRRRPLTFLFVAYCGVLGAAASILVACLTNAAYAEQLKAISTASAGEWGSKANAASMKEAIQCGILGAIAGGMLCSRKSIRSALRSAL